MNDLITDQIEWLLSSNGNTNRMGRHILTLSGFLAPETIPADIEQQLTTLSRQVTLQDIFESLMQSLNNLTRHTHFSRADLRHGEPGQTELSRLLDQVEATRKDIAACEAVNYAQLIAWIVSLATTRKLLKPRGRR